MRPGRDRPVPARRGLGALAGVLGLAALACSTTYSEADVEDAEYRAERNTPHEVKMDEELGAMGGRNAEALGEAGEQVIIESDR